MRNACGSLIAEPRERRPLGRPRRRRQNNAEIRVTEIECEGEDWSRLANSREQLENKI